MPGTPSGENHSSDSQTCGANADAARLQAAADLAQVALDDRVAAASAADRRSAFAAAPRPTVASTQARAAACAADWFCVAGSAMPSLNPADCARQRTQLRLLGELPAPVRRNRIDAVVGASQRAAQGCCSRRALRIGRHLQQRVRRSPGRAERCDGRARCRHRVAGAVRIARRFVLDQVLQWRLERAAAQQRDRWVLPSTRPARSRQGRTAPLYAAFRGRGWCGRGAKRGAAHGA